MQQHRFPDFTKHKAEHDALIKQVAVFQGNYEAGRISMSIQVLQFLKSWLEHHIQERDQRYAPYLKAAA
jgi:hemerythrin-like metal-binding protein